MAWVMSGTLPITLLGLWWPCVKSRSSKITESISRIRNFWVSAMRDKFLGDIFVTKAEIPLTLEKKLYLLLTAIPANTNFWPKSTAHGVTQPFYGRLRTSEKFLWSRHVKLIRERVRRLRWRYLISFLSYPKLSGGWERNFSAPIVF